VGQLFYSLDVDARFTFSGLNFSALVGVDSSPYVLSVGAGEDRVVIVVNNDGVDSSSPAPSSSFGNLTLVGLCDPKTLLFHAHIEGNNVVIDADRHEADKLREGDIRVVEFCYIVADDQRASTSAPFIISVIGVNDAPVTEDDSVVVSEDDRGVFLDVLANDSDVDEGDSLRVDGEPIPAQGLVGQYGTLMRSGDDLSFTPSEDLQSMVEGESVVVSYSLTVEDDYGGRTPSKLFITIVGVNDAPTVEDIRGKAFEDGGPVTFDVVGDDVDDDDSPETLKYSIVSQPSEGSVSFDSGQFVFDPGGDFQYLDEGVCKFVSFTYQAIDRYDAASKLGIGRVEVCGQVDEPLALVPPPADFKILAVDPDAIMAVVNLHLEFDATGPRIVDRFALHEDLEALALANGIPRDCIEIFVEQVIVCAEEFASKVGMSAQAFVDALNVIFAAEFEDFLNGSRSADDVFLIRYVLDEDVWLVHPSMQPDTGSIFPGDFGFDDPLTLAFQSVDSQWLLSWLPVSESEDLSLPIVEEARQALVSAVIAYLVEVLGREEAVEDVVLVDRADTLALGDESDVMPPMAVGDLGLVFEDVTSSLNLNTSAFVENDVSLQAELCSLDFADDTANGHVQHLYCDVSDDVGFGFDLFDFSVDDSLSFDFSGYDNPSAAVDFYDEDGAEPVVSSDFDDLLVVSDSEVARLIGDFDFL